MMEDATLVSDAIERIKEAEKSAEETVRRSRAEAKRLIAEAHDSGERLLDEGRRELRAEEERLIESARADAQGTAKQLSDESGASIDALRRAGQLRVGTGVKKVLERIGS